MTRPPTGLGCSVALSAVLVLFGLVISFVGLVGWIDPVGAQHANDNDPFGPPSPWWTFALVVAAGISLIILGVVVVLVAHRRARNSR